MQICILFWGLGLQLTLKHSKEFDCVENNNSGIQLGSYGYKNIRDGKDERNLKVFYTQVKSMQDKNL